jgi:hypothetical protein
VFCSNVSKIRETLGFFGFFKLTKLAVKRNNLSAVGFKWLCCLSKNASQIRIRSTSSTNWFYEVSAARNDLTMCPIRGKSGQSLGFPTPQATKEVKGVGIEGCNKGILQRVTNILSRFLGLFFIHHSDKELNINE